MDGWSLFRKFSSRVKRRSRTPTTHSATIDVVDEPTMTSSIAVPETQSILLLYGPKQPYKVVENYPVPKLENEDEVLVKTCTIGLNPIDWKAPDYNFAIPELPYISGRESSGDVCQVLGASSRLKTGDRVRPPIVTYAINASQCSRILIVNRSSLYPQITGILERQHTRSSSLLLTSMPSDYLPSFHTKKAPRWGSPSWPLHSRWVYAWVSISATCWTGRIF